MSAIKAKLIHVACIQVYKQGLTNLLLRQIEPFRYVWFRIDPPQLETETAIWGGSSEEAIFAAHKQWDSDQIRTLKCGFRYALPERDEVGTNALFHQMVSSYSSTTGTYFDEELGYNCHVQNASNEALSFWKRLQQTT